MYSGQERRSKPDQRLAERRVASRRQGPTDPILDVKDWLIPKPGKFTKPVFVRQLADGRTAVYFIKTPSGWPFDIRLVDGVGLYDRVTENDSVDSNGNKIGWPGNAGSNPCTYKLRDAHMPPVAPRYYCRSQGRYKFSSTPSLTYARYSTSDCTTNVQQSVGAAEWWIGMTSKVDFGGDLGIQDSLVNEFFYTPISPGLYKNRERFYLTAESGWVMWDFYNSTNGTTWKLNNSTIKNKFLVPDPALVPVQPCPIQL